MPTPPRIPIEPRVVEDPAETAAERLARDVARLPRAFVAAAFERLEAVLPERGKGIAREAAKATDETILEFMTKERRTVPR